jgi:methylenetetrahydrofolate dehydrogenase (NADP+)/methenyltetrahydrofolate cyclohydrolase
MVDIIDGRQVAADLCKHVADHVKHLQTNYGVIPGLAVVLVGDDPASQIYVRNKRRQAEAVGIASFEYRLAKDSSLAMLLDLISTLNKDPRVHGILVQLPLPRPIDADRVIDAIDTAKDVDGFKPVNLGRLLSGGDGTIPCTPLGCLLLLKRHLNKLQGLHAVVLGRSNIVGKPMAALLLREDCTVTIAHSHTQNLAEECARADILVVAVGRPEFVKGHWLKPGATVIDVGINRIETDTDKTRLVGDVDFTEALNIVKAITPVPGGVGPMTIACLLLNTLKAVCRQVGMPVAQP